MSSLTRNIYSPTSSVNRFTAPIPIDKGGTDGVTAVEAVNNIGGIPLDHANLANGWVQLDTNELIPEALFSPASQGGSTVTGPSELLIQSLGLFTITNYDSNHSYVITASAGTISQDKDRLYYRAPSTPGNYSITIDDKVISVTVKANYVEIPSIIAPANAEASITYAELESALYANDRAQNDAYGMSLALSGDGQRLAIGAHNKTVLGIVGAGQVYIYTKSGSTWVLENTLSASDKVANDAFGRSIAFDELGDRLVVGANKKTVASIAGAGQVYIYMRSGSSWVLESTLSASDKVANDNFGTSVSLDSTASRLAVGANAKDPSATTNAGQVYVYTQSGSVWTLETTITASDKVANDEFGISVSLDSLGSRLVIGAQVKTVGGIAGAGQVYVYARSGVTWSLETTISAADKVANDNFGISVAISKDSQRLAIGANNKSVNGIVSAGQIYIYVKYNSTWILESIKYSSTISYQEYFGTSLVWSEDQLKLLIGAYNADSDTITNTGGVYTYSLQYDAQSLVRQPSIVNFTSSPYSVTGDPVISELEAFDKATSDSYGASVAVSADGQRLVIGAQAKTVGGIAAAGQVYIYVKSGSTWTLETTLVADDKAANDNFGSALAIDSTGSRLLIGASGKDVSGIVDCGQVYTYIRVGSVWSLESVLSGSDRATSDAFGSAIAMDVSGTILAVGAKNKTVSAAAGAGKVYLYTRSGSVWILDTTLTSSSVTANDNFGSALALSQNGLKLAIGVSGKTSGGVTACGVVVLYNKVSSVWTEDVTLVASDKVASDAFGRSVCFNSDSTLLTIGAPYANSATATDSGKVYIFNNINNTWVEQTFINDISNAPLHYFGYSLSIAPDGSKIYIGIVGDGAPDTPSAGIVYELLLAYHVSSDWQLATDPGFNTIINSITDSNSNKLTWQVTDLLEGLDYYYRCRHKANGLGYSDWSSVYKLTTRDQFIPQLELGVLTAYDKATADYYGISIAVSNDGSRLAIGAYNKTISGLNGAGKVYTYTRSGSTWTLEAEITASDKAAGDYFGIAVAFAADGSRLAVGASNKTVLGISQCGKVYIYTRSGSIWTEETTIIAADKVANDYFGRSISLNSNASRIAIGASGKTVSGVTACGQVYFYTRVGSVWTLESTLVASDKAASNAFGISVSLADDNSKVAIGACNKTVSGLATAGQVYMYNRSNNAWVDETPITASDKVASDQFGYSVSLNADGTILGVGAQGKTVSSLSTVGQTYIFIYSNNVWNESIKFSESDKVASDNFGGSVAITGDASLLAVGAYQKDPGGVSNAGQVYFYY